jgi:CD109 antigen
LILHVQSNAMLESFSYIVVAKGLVLYASQERMLSTVHTLALTLSPEMAPAATVLVYQPTTRGVTLADSLTFPVDGISRHNVSSMIIYIVFHIFAPLLLQLAVQHFISL